MNQILPRKNFASFISKSILIVLINLGIFSNLAAEPFSYEGMISSSTVGISYPALETGAIISGYMNIDVGINDAFTDIDIIDFHFEIFNPGALPFGPTGDPTLDNPLIIDSTFPSAVSVGSFGSTDGDGEIIAGQLQLQILVPPFVNTSDYIVIDLNSGSGTLCQLFGVTQPSCVIPLLTFDGAFSLCGAPISCLNPVIITGSGAESADINADLDDCQDSVGDYCAEFQFTNFVEGQTITFDAGNGTQCNGNGNDNVYLVLNGSCTLLGSGSTPDQSVTVPAGITEFSVYICRNGNGDVALCNIEYEAICGNGVVEGDEECDDGNTEPGDGCFECMVEVPTGAVCFEDGSCADGLTADEAEVAGGFYQGDNTSCNDAMCIPVCQTLSVGSCDTPVQDFQGFGGGGIENPPSGTQLDACFWTITGFSSASDLTRGITGGGVTTGGLYAYDADGNNDVSDGNQALWIQPGSSDFTPGDATLTVCNTSGGAISDIDISYDLLWLNDAGRANSFNFSWSTDNSFYNLVPALDFTSPEAADTDPTVQIENKSTSLIGINLADAACLYLRWTSDDVSGTGSRDEFGLDNIVVAPSPCGPIPGSIHGFKFNDLNGNGTYEPNENELGLEGIEFNLLDQAGSLIASQTSDAIGEFWFVELGTGTYTVQEIVTDPWQATTPTSTQITINSGEEYVAFAGQANLPPNSPKIEVQTNDLIFGNQMICLADAGEIIPPADLTVCDGEPIGPFEVAYDGEVHIDPNLGNDVGEPTGPPCIMINEIRIDQPSADDDEYVELVGTPGTSLDGLTLLIVGDGSGGSGTIENVTDLTGQVIPPSGYFLMGELTLAVADLVVNLNHENSDNLTFLLVDGFSGMNGDDLDNEDDCILDYKPWSSIVDGVALIEEPNPPSGTECHYGIDLDLFVIGPDGTFVPAHVYNCPGSGWQIGQFDPIGGNDTPGAANTDCKPVINEIRIDQPSADNDEYFELLGVPGTALPGYWYIVIGDGSSALGSGVIEAVVDLGSQVIPPSGFLTVAEGTFSLGVADYITTLDFENNDNTTHLLVTGFTGMQGDDLDTDNDGILDVIPWLEVVDGIALIEEPNPPAGTEYHYGDDLGLPVLGPNGDFVPAHAYLDPCTGTWTIGQFDPVDGDDTPGEPNAVCVPPAYAYIWLAVDDAGQIVEILDGGFFSPYACTFEELAIGDYCIYGVSFRGTFSEFEALNYTDLSALISDIQQDVICGDLSECQEAEVRVIPDPPVVQDVVICGEGSTNLTVQNANPDASYFWYSSDPTEGMIMVEATGTSFDPMTAAGNQEMFWVNCTLDGCTSEATKVTVTVLEEASSAEFSYDDDLYCPNGADPIFMLGPDAEIGLLSYEPVPPSDLTLAFDPETGVIDASESDRGTYKITNVVGSCGNLILTGVFDGDLPGQLPKFVELYALVDIPDLSIYGVGSANNGDGSDGEEFSFPAGTSAEMGDFIYIASETTVFTTYFGMAPDYTSDAMLINGDDAIEVFCNGIVIDQFGEIDVDGSGEPWEYTDGWAYRNASTGPDFGYQPGNWVVMTDVLNGAATNDEVGDNKFPIMSFFSTIPPLCPNSMHMVTITIDDTEDPEIVCPADIVIVLDPGLCAANVQWEDPEVSDNCPGPLDLMHVSGPLSGDLLHKDDSPWTVTYQVTDANGNGPVMCSFEIQVLEYPDPITSIACNDNVQISLDDQCEILVTPDMILEGGPYGCYDDFIVTVEGVNDGELGGEPLITSIGTYGVTVEDENGNYCWSTIIAEDKLPPVFDCSAVELRCVDPIFGDEGVGIDVSDACDDDLDLDYFDTYIETGSTCENRIIERTWTATDDSGNSSTCVQEMTIVPLTMDDLRMPDVTIAVPCGTGTDPGDLAAYFDADKRGINPYDCSFSIINNAYLTPNNDGYSKAYPYVVGSCQQYIPLSPSVCNIGATYTDQNIPDCAGDKVLRFWHILDWCRPEDGTKFHTQVIKVLDEEDPYIDIVVNDDVEITESTDPWGCDKVLTLPHPEHTSDNCGDVSYRVEVPGITNDPFNLPFSETKVFSNPHYFPADQIDQDAEGRYVIVNAPKGTYVVTYIAEDACGNISRDEIVVNIVDETPPVAIAKQNIVVSLTSGSTDDAGIAKLYVESVNNGSHDGCSEELFMEIRREDSNDCWNKTFRYVGFPFLSAPYASNPASDPDAGQYVKFCCDDLGPDGYGEVRVVLRVWDDGNCNGIPGELGEDNYNDTWATVRVEDKLPPTIQCPPDVTIDCDEDYLDLSLTGSATAFTTCGAQDASFSDRTDLDACGNGVVTRTWSVVTGGGAASCVQKIYIESVDPFEYGDISWPQDMELDCAPVNAGEPTWNTVPCSLVGSSLDQQVFEFEDGACYKELNHWTVIDWCTYDPDASVPSGIWTKTQVVKVIDTSKPELSCEDYTLWATEDCLAQNVELTNSASDMGSDCPSDWLKWEVCLDINYDWSCDYIWTSDAGTALGFGDNVFYVEPTAQGENVVLPAGLSSDEPRELDLAIGEHRVVWTVHDGCGNVSTCTQFITVEDGKAPTPYCISNLVTAVMDHSGQVDIWAIDFNIGSTDNCPGELRYTFSEVPPEDDPNYDESLRSSYKRFTCTDGLGFNFLRMYVWDAAGNSDFCSVSLSVQDNDVCAGLLRVDGRIQNEYGEGVENTVVKLMDNETEMDLYMTNSEGHYEFIDMPSDPDYLIVPYRNDNHINGVSTLDLVLMQKHILGLELLDSPYKVIAADANNNGTVAATDLLDLRKLILGVIEELPNNLSWRFVHMGEEFSDMMNPFPFTEVISPYDPSGIMDFVGVKIGDVNGSAEPNSLAQNAAEIRSAKTLEWEQNLNHPNQIDILAKDFDGVLGMQFTLDLGERAGEFVTLTSGVLDVSTDNMGLFIEEGLMSFSWSESVARNVQDGEILFSIQFADAGENVLVLNNRVTSSEMYTQSNNGVETHHLSIQPVTTNILTGDEVALLQNVPNPFRDITEIRFYLPEKSENLRLQIFDVKGALIKEINESFDAGTHSIQISNQELPGAGVYSYKMSTENRSITKRMIHIH